MIGITRCSFRPSSHVKDMMIERGVSKTELLEAIMHGAKRAAGKKIISLFMGVEVVYRQVPCNYFVITVYWKR